MSAFDIERAHRFLREVSLAEDNERITRYWLSLWQGDQLPRRADFRPRDVGDLLPVLCLFDVVPDESVKCRLAGSSIVEALREDITGKDWLARSLPEDRPTRLARFSAVARGAIGRGFRAGQRQSGERQLAEEVMLPFGEIAPDGSRQVMNHISWRPTVYNPTRLGFEHTAGLSVDFLIVPLSADSAEH